MSGPVTATVIDDDAGFTGLLDEWRSLRSALDAGSVLQSPDVLWRWWQAHGDEHELAIVAARRSGELAGVLALQLSRRRISGLRYRVLEFLGMPNELCRPEPLVRAADTAVWRSMLDCIGALGHRWDLVQLDEIDGGSWWADAAAAWADSHELTSELRFHHSCPYLLDTGGSEAFLATRSRRFKKRMRTLEQRLSQHGDLSVDHAHEESAGLAAAIADFFDVEARSWKARKRIHSGDDPAYRRFIDTLSDLGRYGIRRHAIVLKLGERPVAATIGLGEADVYYGLQIAHDRDFDEYSPGTLLEWHELQWFLDRSPYRRYEFLGGDQANKSRWCTAEPATQRFIAGRGGWHWRLRTFYKHRLLPRLRRGD
ncbi:MAG: GNAT family N-acetyltransferase [Pseudomonadota bacterium]